MGFIGLVIRLPFAGRPLAGSSPVILLGAGRTVAADHNVRVEVVVGYCVA
jgi:hypothetical protein